MSKPMQIAGNMQLDKMSIVAGMRVHKRQTVTADRMRKLTEHAGVLVHASKPDPRKPGVTYGFSARKAAVAAEFEARKKAAP